MATEWRKELDPLFADFKNQVGQKMLIQIIRATYLPEMIRAANKRNREAIGALNSVNHWMETANKAVAEGDYPACAYCRTALYHGDVGGWGLVSPVGQGTGMMGAFCVTCIEKDSDELIQKFRDAMEQDIGAVMETVQ